MKGSELLQQQLVAAKPAPHSYHRQEAEHRAALYSKRDADDAAVRNQALRGVPFRLRDQLRADYIAAVEHAEPGHGLTAKNEAHARFLATADYLREHAREKQLTARVERLLARDVLREDSSDASVKSWARRRAGEAGSMAATASDLLGAFAALRSWVGAWRVGEQLLRAPDFQAHEDGAITAERMRGYVSRLLDRQWWTRAARVMLGRGIEAAMVDAGRVHRHADLYVSNRNVSRALLAAKRNRDNLRDTELENELGERINLGELHRKSLANPLLRFSELAVRSKGLGTLAEGGDWVGWFITLTTPSRFHARHWDDGSANEKFALGKAKPECRASAAQRYLVDVWAKVRAMLARDTKKRGEAVPFFGLRVVEPHHDGTPHWHMLVYFPRADAWRALRLFKRYALEESPDEKGARRRRFNVKRMRKVLRNGKEGSAVGYLLKYLLKMTTGAGMGTTTSSGDDGDGEVTTETAKAAHRTRVWASLHGIRQFQTYGTPPIGLWREARRIREELTAAELPHAGPAQLELFERMRSTADASDYAGHVKAVGGVARPRKFLAFELVKEDALGPNRYGEARDKIVKGIGLASSATVAVITRVHTWVKRWARDNAPPMGHFAAMAEVGAGDGAGAAVAVASPLFPWTRGNNCNGPSDPLPEPMPAPASKRGGVAVPFFLSWPEPAPDWPS
jgi:hypothetical protein